MSLYIGELLLYLLPQISYVMRFNIALKEPEVIQYHKAPPIKPPKLGQNWRPPQNEVNVITVQKTHRSGP